MLKTMLPCLLWFSISACDDVDLPSQDPVEAEPSSHATDLQKTGPVAQAVDPFCVQSCGCDGNGQNCNFGTRNTDTWCKCCAANCGGNLGACNQQGYLGDQGFPAGTSRQCGCVHKVNSHDFTLSSNADLASCYSNLRANSGVTHGLQTIWHPGVSNCASGQHVHIDPSFVATGVFRFGIDCLGASTRNGQTCSSQVVNGLTCTFLWQGPS